MKDMTPYDPRTLEGLRRGFGWCRKCGNTWNWKKPCTVPTGPHTGTFPVCLDCGWDMPVAEILAHLKAIGDSREPLELPNGTVWHPDIPDLKLAERWLLIWRQERRAGEDPYHMMNRLETPPGPKDWSPRGKVNHGRP